MVRQYVSTQKTSEVSDVYKEDCWPNNTWNGAKSRIKVQIYFQIFLDAEVCPTTVKNRFASKQGESQPEMT